MMMMMIIIIIIIIIIINPYYFFFSLLAHEYKAIDIKHWSYKGLQQAGRQWTCSEKRRLPLSQSHC